MQMPSSPEEDAWGSHLPVLKAIGRICPHISHVVELGCGRYSTPTFLDKACYPNLTRLTSLENNETWAKQVQSCIADVRLHLIFGSDILLATQLGLVTSRVPPDLIFI